MGVFEGAFPQWAYLVGYNAVSAFLWLTIFLRAALACLSGADTGVQGGPDSVYPAVRGLVLFAQTLAALEILHALIGMSTCAGVPFFNLLLPSAYMPTQRGGTSTLKGRAQ